MQVELSDNAIRFLNKLVPSLMLRPDNADFLSDAQAVAEILNEIAPKQNGTSNIQA